MLRSIKLLFRMKCVHHLMGRQYTVQLWKLNKIESLPFRYPRPYACRLSTHKELGFSEFIPMLNDSAIDDSTRDKYTTIFNLTKDGNYPVLTEEDVAGLDTPKLIKFIEVLERGLELSPQIPTHRILLPIRRYFLTHSFHENESWMGLFLAMDLNKYATSEEERQEMLDILSHHDKIDFADGRYILALVHYEGRHVKRDLKRALALLEVNVRASCSRSMNLLGMMLRDGQGVQQDIERASNLFLCSGLQRNPEGYLLLVDLHKKGLLEKSLEKELEYYHEAEKLNSPVAAHNLACAYFLGKGCQQDYRTAFKYFTRAANLGFVMSQINLGNMYFNGYGTGVDLVEARKWYSRASEKKKDAIYLVRAVDEKLAQLKNK